MQQFDSELLAEESAQTKYYEMKAAARPFIEPKLVSQQPPQPHQPQPQKMLMMASHDNISIHSAPTLTRSTSGGHMASPPAVRLRDRKWNKAGGGGHRLANSASTNSLSRKSLTNSQSSLTAPRPKSYVPFQGCVETPSPLPGRAARDILHALSYAPTHESFSIETQQKQLSISENLNHQRHKIKGGPNPLLKSKSSSFASLMCHQIVPDELNCTAPPILINPLQTAISKNPVMYVHTELEPIYAPTNPLNHPENRAVFNGHPPVIYPPPDLVTPAPASGLAPDLSSPTPAPASKSSMQMQSSSMSSTSFCNKSPPGLVLMTGNAGHGSPGSYNVIRRSNASLGSPGLSSASSSGFETARSSSSSSMSSIMFENHASLAVQNAGQNNAVLESIRETSPMTSSSISRF